MHAAPGRFAQTSLFSPKWGQTRTPLPHGQGRAGRTTAGRFLSASESSAGEHSYAQTLFGC